MTGRSPGAGPGKLSGMAGGWMIGRRPLRPVHASPGNHSPISRAADSGESDACTTFSRFDRL